MVVLGERAGVRARLAVALLMSLVLALSMVVIGAPGSYAAQPDVESITLGSQTPSPVAPGNSATYAVAICDESNGTVTLGVRAVESEGLPGGVTASFATPVDGVLITASTS